MHCWDICSSKLDCKVFSLDTSLALEIFCFVSLMLRTCLDRMGISVNCTVFLFNARKYVNRCLSRWPDDRIYTRLYKIKQFPVQAFAQSTVSHIMNNKIVLLKCRLYSVVVNLSARVWWNHYPVLIWNTFFQTATIRKRYFPNEKWTRIILKYVWCNVVGIIIVKTFLFPERIFHWCV